MAGVGETGIAQMNVISNGAQTAEKIASRLQYYEKWKHVENEIAYLIIANDRYIVFIDKDTDVDWSLRDDHADASERYDRPEFNTALNRVAALETTPCDEIAPKMKLQFKRLLGEGVARALDQDFKGANEILNSAELYIQARSQETSRYWYLSASAAMTLPFVGVGIALWIARGWLQAELGETAFWVMLSACTGALGALLSVIGRTGKQHFDCSAGKRLHYLEAASRIWAGTISGILVSLAVHAQIFLTALTHNGNMPAIMMLAALASGLSERLATSIIADLTSARANTDTGSET